MNKVVRLTNFLHASEQWNGDLYLDNLKEFFEVMNKYQVQEIIIDSVKEKENEEKKEEKKVEEIKMNIDDYKEYMDGVRRKTKVRNKRKKKKRENKKEVAF